MNITCIIHTRNSESTLQKALESVAWVDELMVVDMESTDRTLEIARHFTSCILTARQVPRVDGIRNEYIEKAKNEWILVLDSDEFLPADAKDEICRLLSLHGRQYDAFAFPRFNRIAGQILRGSGWYPDHQIRLVRKGAVRWSDAVHVLPEITTGVHRLLELTPPDCLHIHHDNYRNLQQFLERQLEYARNTAYDPDPANFDFASYMAEAYERMAMRSDPAADGDLSRVLALALAWDSIVRGMIHWDTLNPKPPLGYAESLPVAAARVPWFQIKLRRWLGPRHSLRFFLRKVRNKFRGFFLRHTRP